MDWFTFILSAVSFVISITVAIKQFYLSKQTNSLPILIDIFREYRSEEFRKHREYLSTGLKKEYPEKTELSSLQGDAKTHAVVVSHFFDHLGFLVNEGIVKEKLVLRFIGGSIVHYWDILKPYITAERKDTPYHMYFEDLAVRAANNPAQAEKEKTLLKFTSQPND